METIIIICLMIIIVLLIQDKMVIRMKQNQVRENLPDRRDNNGIMGKPKVLQMPDKPISVPAKSLKDNKTVTPDLENTAVEKGTDLPLPEELPDGIPNEVPEDSFEYLEVSSDFSNGVTYNELSTVAHVLRQPELPEASVREETAKIVQKMEGTELFALLESGIAGASEKIAALLDQSLSTTKPTTVKRKKNELNDFDIEDFL